MTKKRLVTTILASAVVVGFVVGCNSNSGTCCSGGLTPGTEAKGEVTSLISGQESRFTLTGETGDKTGEAGEAVLTRTYDSLGNEVCLTAAEACSFSMDLEATTCTERVDAEDKYTTEDGLAVLEEVQANSSIYNYDITKDMVVYGGTMLPVVNGFSTSDLKVDVKGMSCGQAIKLDGSTTQAGFANPDHTVFAMVKSDEKEPQFTGVDTMDDSGNFTIDLSGIDLSGDNPEISLFSIKKADKAGTTGASK